MNYAKYFMKIAIFFKFSDDFGDVIRFFGVIPILQYSIEIKK